MLPTQKQYKLPSVYLLGHRGARGEFIENSQQGFDALYQYYLHSHHHTNHSNKYRRRLIGIEFDVQLTADDVLVVVHDDTLERFYQLPAHIDQLSYNQLVQLTDKTLPILRLQDLLPRLSDYQRIELEIKTHPRSQPQRIVSALMHTFDTVADSVFNPYQLALTFTSFDKELLACIQRSSLLSSFSTGLLIEENENPQQINLAQRLGCQHLGLHHASITPEFIANCKKSQITTSAWTVNDAQQIDYLSSIGVDYIITDYPCLYSNE